VDRHWRHTQYAESHHLDLTRPPRAESLLTRRQGRLVRLIPNSETNADLAATKALFNYRLSSDPAQARIDWLDIVEGRHELWERISSEKRELIRSFFSLVNLEIVKRARPSSTYNFGRAAIGNLFLTGYLHITRPCLFTFHD
jgi:hypothetical protein